MAKQGTTWSQRALLGLPLTRHGAHAGIDGPAYPRLWLRSPQNVIAAVPGLSSGWGDPADLGRAASLDDGHGRIELIRELMDCRSHDISYVITSLDPAAHRPAPLLQHSRDHWQIKNALFHFREIACLEDYCHVRISLASPPLAAIHDATHSLIRQTGQKPHRACEASVEQKWKTIFLVRRAWVELPR